MPTSVLRRAPGSPALLPSAVRLVADAMLAELELSHTELSVLLTNDRHIHALNLRHRSKDRPTDVLAFPLAEAGDATFSSTPRLLGDVVISLDTAARQARGRKRALLPEVRFLLAHGLLHLIGYDHGNPSQKRAMDAMTRRLVRAVEHDSRNVRKKAKSNRMRPAPARPKPQPKARRSPAQARASHAK